MKINQVCPLNECDKAPLLNVEVGNHKHNFCCQKGFEKSLKDFQAHLKNEVVELNN